MDRDHLAQASDRAQTIKLADLIDNARDICHHDESFARTYLREMASLLEVLERGHPALRVRARELLDSCEQKLGIAPALPDYDDDDHRSLPAMESEAKAGSPW